jgi:glycerol-3-phosphate dehydrogenase
MDRATGLQLLRRTASWDIAIIGGGATGLGSAVDAASRGYRTVLLEQGDFAQATSSRSTKLVHGGVRYLRQGNMQLVQQALHERGLLLRAAPDFVHPLEFVIPTYRWWERSFYAAGLHLYDRLAGSLGLGQSRGLSADEVKARLPTIVANHLRGGVLYHDAQFDDARFAVALAQAFVALGGTALNYAPVEALAASGTPRGTHIIRGCDAENGEAFEIEAKSVINATGVFCDDIRRMEEPQANATVVPSQGSHLVLDAQFLPGNTALMVPNTDDRRVLFAIPWLGRLLVGTTDVAVERAVLEPRPTEREIEFILAHAGRYLDPAPARTHVRSCFAGLRGLALAKQSARKTARMPRDHRVLVSEQGLVTINGGKWTTYRLMARDAVDAAARAAHLPERRCLTDKLLFRRSDRIPGEQLHPRLPDTSGDVITAVRHEMARTVADTLARRTRALFLDADAALEIAPRVARIMAAELQRDEAWIENQLVRMRALAANYVIAPSSESKSES